MSLCLISFKIHAAVWYFFVRKGHLYTDDVTPSMSLDLYFGLLSYAVTVAQLLIVFSKPNKSSLRK